VNVALPPGVEITAPLPEGAKRILTPDALAFVASLQRQFGTRRLELLQHRSDRRWALAAGTPLGFLPETAEVRDGDWQVAETPADLLDRRVEITGPAEPRMLINALNSGARVFMADIEDALSPTWANVIGAQSTLLDAVDREVDFTSDAGKHYALDEETATSISSMRGAQPWRAGAAPAWARTTTCPSWNRTSRPGSGMRSSSSARKRWTSRSGPSERPCSSRPSGQPSRWRRSCMSCVSTRPG